MLAQPSLDLQCETRCIYHFKKQDFNMCTRTLYTRATFFRAVNFEMTADNVYKPITLRYFLSWTFSVILQNYFQRREPSKI